MSRRSALGVRRLVTWRDPLDRGHRAGSASATRPAPSARRPAGRLAVLVLLAAGSAACRQDMHDAPRYDPLEASTVLSKGSSAQPFVPGTVPRGLLRLDDHLYTGVVNDEPVDTFPFPITRADLDRGEEQFNIYCAPCHSRSGDGNGMVVQRGYRQPPTYHSDRLRQMPVGYLYHVIANGFGVMPDYRSQVTVDDRWRIVAHIRVLQLSQHATAEDIPADVMQRLMSGETAPAKAEGH